jgi:hypothetical protein
MVHTKQICLNKPNLASMCGNTNPLKTQVVIFITSSPHVPGVVQKGEGEILHEFF